jgi:hypothetical protein
MTATVLWDKTKETFCIMDIKLHVHEAGNLKPPDRIFNAYSSDVGKKEIMHGT